MIRSGSPQWSIGRAVGGATIRTPVSLTSAIRPAVGVVASGWAKNTGTRGSGE
jgi:hypothetical protein